MAQVSAPAAAGATPGPAPITITEILPTTGLVYSEKSSMTELLCRPKILPIKSMALEKLEKLEKELLTAKGTGGPAQPGAPAGGLGRLGGGQ